MLTILRERLREGRHDRLLREADRLERAAEREWAEFRDSTHHHHGYDGVFGAHTDDYQERERQRRIIGQRLVAAEEEARATMQRYRDRAERLRAQAAALNQSLRTEEAPDGK